MPMAVIVVQDPSRICAWRLLRRDPAASDSPMASSSERTQRHGHPLPGGCRRLLPRPHVCDRGRRALAAVGFRKAPDRPSGRLLLATILIGFGAWHVADAVLSHWVLGIHRIRMDSGSPLIWDLLWFGIFGVMPLLIGWLMRRAGGDGGMPVSRGATVIRLLVGLLVIGAVILSLGGRLRITGSRPCRSRPAPLKSASSGRSELWMDGWRGLTRPGS